MPDETDSPPEVSAPPADKPAQKQPAAAKTLQPRMKATGQRRSKERGSHTHKKNPGKRPKKGGS